MVGKPYHRGENISDSSEPLQLRYTLALQIAKVALQLRHLHTPSPGTRQPDIPVVGNVASGGHTNACM